MSYLGNEETLVELPAIEYLTGVLGYNFIEGDKLTPKYGERDTLSEVILSKRMKTSLKKLNPWISDENAEKVVRKFCRAESLGTGLLEINEKIYDYIVHFELTVDQVIDAKKETPTVKLIDFDDIDNNDFLVTRQFVIKGQQENIRPDILIFVNGMPVVVLECKSPFKETKVNENVGKYDGFQQLRRYMNGRDASFVEGAERLFYTNFITGILNKYTAFIGTISSGYKHYVEWKDAYPLENREVFDAQNTPQNILLQGVFRKENLLDIMQNFIVYDVDKENSRKVKKVCRYQQFRAVQKCLKRLEEGKTTLSKGGVVWHTQGSGKSLTMVFLSKKIRNHKKLFDATIVIVTDRMDLDEQIFETFSNNITNGTPIRAESIEEMKRLLRNSNAQIVTTTIQKFQSEKEESKLQDVAQGEKLYFEKEYEVLSTKPNIIVMTDEAHRSQYKGTATNLRTALPNAAFIGFTGTPIDKEDKSTPRTFGSYIDQYSIKQAVDDGATVKIVYEGRRPDLHILGDSLEELFDQAFGDKTDEEKEAIKEKYANKRTVVEAEERIEQVAKDILKHYKEYIYPNGFKAQIVCLSRDACVKYYNALNKHMKDIMGEELECKIIFSGSNNDEPHLREHHTTKEEQKEILKSFKKKTSESNLCFLIVKDMLLTGFDAPIEQVMYLDRPLKEHNLLQAIARVNRTCGDSKKCGYVVDYYGVLDFLEEALAIFDKDELGKPMESMGSLYDEMLSYRENVMRMFQGRDKNNIDDLVKVIEPEDKRAEFEVAFKKFAGAVEALMPRHISIDIQNDVKWLSYIRAAAKVRFNPEKKLDISDCGEKVKALISEHLTSSGVIGWIQPITLFEEDFQSKIETQVGDEAVASSMEHAIKNVINLKMDENPVFYTSLFEKLQQILEETKNDWIEKKARLKEFIDREMEKGEQGKADELGLSKREFAFFETLREVLEGGNEVTSNVIKEDSVDYIANDVVEFSKGISKELDKLIRENYLVDWTNNPSKTAQVEQKIYMFLISKSSKLREVFGLDAISKIKQLKESIIKLAKIHYATLD
ncbi:type I restriction endonuclease subunit R [Clostridium botulinum]|uniref:type I restriction endonuclease subunit R n=1 Tax=Clostridium botulinum TaxID=1491 RepID=UPI000774241D|nr:type I restriction endonuclease subunit R [Clostridium botulinum]MBY6951037.1 type I restriction endonuclease subunit R [Clostridium botulinum]MCR1140301.1 type I restriction endonuclease subunit R [Clostridium botulinum]NEZ79939.1 type I restriction endonuclease subunit R [Clostridium botulinum]NFA17954.1 type I restriction endonuclease subunit R [Clostridium botulinum]NFA54509.1 type I restriction endonuclease subunit R [Clostridium botulinum]